MNANNMQTLRDALFKSLAELGDMNKKVDVSRHRAISETCKVLVDSARVEVELAIVMKGSMTVPFIEDQADERKPSSGNVTQLPSAKQTPMERAAAVLGAGPSPEHPWRKKHSA